MSLNLEIVIPTYFYVIGNIHGMPLAFLTSLSGSIHSVT